MRKGLSARLLTFLGHSLLPAVVAQGRCCFGLRVIDEPVFPVEPLDFGSIVPHPCINLHKPIRMHVFVHANGFVTPLTRKYMFLHTERDNRTRPVTPLPNTQTNKHTHIHTHKHTRVYVFVNEGGVCVCMCV